MVVDVVMPKMGESITEGTILEWRKNLGDSIEKDEILLEIGTDKVDSEIPSSHSGTLVEVFANPNDVIEVGKVIAKINTDEDLNVIKTEDTKTESPVVKFQKNKTSQNDKKILNSEKKVQYTDQKKFFTPVVLKIAREEGISISALEALNGTGMGGRVTKRDILEYIKDKPETPIEEQPQKVTSISDNDVVEMDHMRKLIADHMRNSLDTSAHVYVITEVDMTDISDYLKTSEVSFKEREGFKLTYTPFIMYAVVKALHANPDMNASLNGSSITYHKHINIGIAVAINKGLMVPVISKCEELNFLGLCRKVNDVASRTRNKKVSPDELQGSTFSITNFGVFNVTMGTPIINQPNVGILGVGTVKKRPVVIENSYGDSIGIRSMLYLSLGFDHRLIDGAGGSHFIDTVRRNLEEMDLNQLM